MNNIKEHIKINQYKPVYLLYGTEHYLKTLYKNKLKKAILDENYEMNFSYFEGKGIDIQKVIEIAETLPFFSEKRLIVIENSELFKNQSKLADYIKQKPSTTYFVFVESYIDKRNRLYKIVKEIGTISEMNGLDEWNLKLWVTSILGKEKKKITNETLLYFLNKVGTNMDQIQIELEKLICYTMGQEIITEVEIDAVCSIQISNHIFQMVDAIASKDKAKALALYNELLLLREKPLSILFLIARQFNLLMQVKDLERLGYDNKMISEKTGLPPFTIKKYIKQSKNFTFSLLKGAIIFCLEIEEQVKTGRMIDQMGVELLIIQYTKI